MTLIIGWVIVFGSVLGGFAMAGGRPAALFVLAEWSVVGGCSVGFMVASCPLSVIKLMGRLIVRSLKGSPYTRQVYSDLVQVLYEVFRVARQQGVIGLETHVLDPEKSPIVSRYPSFLKNQPALEFFGDAMRPLIDGKLKAEQLKAVLDEQLHRRKEHSEKPVSVLEKVGDALPGLGIVAAVLGIIITMANIDKGIAEVGHHVANALVGTFLGVFLAYGIVHPLAANIEFLNEEEISYLSIIRSGVVAFASGASPLTAAENMRGGIPADRRMNAEDLENLLKSLRADNK